MCTYDTDSFLLNISRYQLLRVKFHRKQISHDLRALSEPTQNQNQRRETEN